MSAQLAGIRHADAMSPAGRAGSSAAERDRRRTVAVLAYPGIRIFDFALCLDLCRGLAPKGEAHAATGTAALQARPLPAEDGTSIIPDWELMTGQKKIDLLVVPCGFVLSDAFGAPGAVAALRRAVENSGRCILFARLPRDARRVQMLLQEISTWSPGAFFEAIGTHSGPIPDGHLTWATGECAARSVFRDLGVEMGFPRRAETARFASRGASQI